MDKRNFLEVGRYDTCTFHFFLVFWDALTSVSTHSIHSFIHIEHLYSASSRKLLRSASNTSTVKQSSLKVRKNASERVLLTMRSSEGRPFQLEGPTTEKARICLVEVQAKGTRRRPCWDERSDRELIAQEENNRLT